MKSAILILMGLAMVIAVSGPASAASQTTNLNVSAILLPGCSVSTAPVSFGATVGSDVTYATGDVTVACNTGIVYNIALNAGNNYGADRRLSNGQPSPAYVEYQLHKDSSYATWWGDSDFGNTYSWGSSLADTGTSVSQSHTVYGVLAQVTGQPPGDYTDTVTVTVHY